MGTQRVMVISGFSGSGKTTLVKALLPHFKAYGWSVNVIKHSHHLLELEPAHKDSAQFRQAGAAEVMVVSPYQMAIMRDLPADGVPSLAQQLARLSPADLVLLEGFKHESAAKIEVWRAATSKPLRADPYTVAIATDSPQQLPTTALRVLDLNDSAAVAHYIIDYFQDQIHA